jgi:hypothetical protein
VVSFADVQEDACSALGCMVRSLDVHSRGLGVNNYVFDHQVRASCLSGHTRKEWSHIHPCSCGFCWAYTRMPGKDSSARVGSLVQKHLAGRLLFCPPTHLHCDSILCGPALPQLSQIHLFSCGFFCKSTPMASEDLSARVGPLVQKTPGRETIVLPPDPLAL